MALGPPDGTFQCTGHWYDAWRRKKSTDPFNFLSRTRNGRRSVCHRTRGANTVPLRHLEVRREPPDAANGTVVKSSCSGKDFLQSLSIWSFSCVVGVPANRANQFDDRGGTT